MARDFVLSIEAGFPRHPKTRKFSRLMGTPLAPAYLVNLWAWAVEAAPSGDISSYDVSDIEDGAGYALCDGKCYQALVDAGFIDEDGAGARVLHNWMDPGRVGYAIARRVEEKQRWRQKKRERGFDWPEIRLNALERDGWQCRECGCPEVLEVHHVVPLRLFQGNREAANSLDNLISLCRPCHAAADAEFRRNEER